MFATRPLLAKGFWGRSADELKRLSHIGMLLILFRTIRCAPS